MGTTLRARALAAFGAALLVACGGSSPSSSSSSGSSPTPSSAQATLISSIDACKLVTDTEASAAVGKTVSNAAGSTVTVPGACFYGSADGSATVLVFGQVFSDQAAADAASPDQIAAAMNASGGGVVNAKPVSGIGDKAVEYNTTGMGSNSGYAIFVFKSNAVIMIAVSPLTDSSVIENLAKTAVSRL